MGVLLMRTVPGDTFEILQADDEIEIDDIFLLVELVPQVSYGDGILTITAANRTVSYGIAGPGRRPGLLRAILSRVPEDEA